MPAMLGTRRVPYLATAWTPRSLPGLVLWLDASNVGQADGTTVARWRDLSGMGNDAIQNTTAEQPTYLASGLNGYPALQGDGIDDIMQGAISPVTAGSAYSVAAAFEASGNGGSLVTSRVTYPFSESRYLSYAGHCDVYGDGMHSSQNTYVSLSAYTTTPHVGSWVYSGTGTTPQFWQDGVSWPILSGVQGTETGSAGYNTFSNVVQEWFPGTIGQIIIYQGALSTVQRRRLEAYLSRRYGIAVI